MLILGLFFFLFFFFFSLLTYPFCPCIPSASCHWRIRHELHEISRSRFDNGVLYYLPLGTEVTYQKTPRTRRVGGVGARYVRLLMQVILVLLETVTFFMRVNALVIRL
ncbi:uncharacterized protein F4812DRAFT_416244 [Daldinia caldariorum]|uniref:uncharacterized protein n=1 Tax=Daldinia caldariorum TaxID=326644 RepID=UPI0020086501|nr:uncharacterized protein F4812DRAFT_416244 [Daldinia caldariorum]KAI1471976.1 hypothetical protein F4812DRAFT_416244 [Daldinia caldariorum]